MMGSFGSMAWLGMDDDWRDDDNSWLGNDDGWRGTDNGWLGNDDSWFGGRNNGLFFGGDDDNAWFGRDNRRRNSWFPRNDDGWFWDD